MAVCKTCHISYEGRDQKLNLLHKEGLCIPTMTAQENAIRIASGDRRPTPPVMSDAVRSRIGGDDAKPLTSWELLRKPPNSLNPRTSPYCYWLDPDGGTMREAVRFDPNGAKPDEGCEAKYTESWQIFKEMGEDKGWTRLGHQLQKESIKLIVETLEKNRPIEKEVMEHFRDVAAYEVTNGTNERARAIAQKSVTTYGKLIEQLEMPIDADFMISELNEISRAQRMAALSPDMRAAIREMIDVEVGSSEARVREMAMSLAGPEESADKELTGPDFIDVSRD